MAYFRKFFPVLMGSKLYLFCKIKTSGKCVVLIRIHSAVHFYFNDNCPLKLCDFS